MLVPKDANVQAEGLFQMLLNIPEPHPVAIAGLCW